MSARNVYHDAVVQALITDGWTITDDPFRLSYGGTELYVDLGAERLTIGAAKDEQRIAVEVQSFLNPSVTYDLHAAIGQYNVYKTVLEELHPERILYLAIPAHVYSGALSNRLGQLLVTRLGLRILVFDADKAEVVRWIN